ncbi:MAG: YggS family pyridoxal phosphate enzyme [Actinomycetota bacterium]|nr:YggS family pyridoxal phosphate enzyme [Actinomycetota bacterium]PLS75179.1 MAG: YggS family pyridoxal phosphate-dependent enzyme [Actinomycetota bacterium]
MEGVAERVAEVRDRIAAAGGDPAALTLVAVTKGFGPEQVAAVRDAGIGDVGENYAQELLVKAGVAEGGPRWHFLGAVQRRKVRALAPFVHLWQSVDRLVAGHEVARHAPGAAVLVQVNVTEQPGRPGCAWSEAPALVEGLCEAGLDVRGLMAVGSADGSRLEFRRLASLRAALGLQEVSIGMSEDLEVAVEEGSTMVRVGRALFGPRPGAAGLRRYSHPRGGC